MSGNIKLAALQTELVVKTDKFQSELKKASDIGVSEADKISDKMSDAVDDGIDKMSALGDGLTLGLTTRFWPQERLLQSSRPIQMIRWRYYRASLGQQPRKQKH